ncbi:hypothetical protein BKA93DRAFT_757808 [Sparassis latifolia]|uniref:Protein FAM32A n=1 Tax=Sparassis crispa TaxID=139825 RepID=A0A401G6D8_9APHY|nr:hypothetical protein SCP_0106120 [Sparassis crispa]GBE77730.1 hypothetical protein SCP_0106120 [Sparassis crispa]
MSDYNIHPGGSLKLKGGVADGGIVKKKKSSKSKSKEKEKIAERERLKEVELLLREEEAKAESPSGSSRNSPALGSSSDKKTAAEKRFEEVQKKRLAAKVAKLANKTHKDRVNEFNNKLEALSEHHDIPKVGPG